MFLSFTSRFSMAEPGFDSEKIRFSLHEQKSTHVSAQLDEGANSNSQTFVRRFTFLGHLVKLESELSLSGTGSGNGQTRLTRLTMDGSEGECRQRAAFLSAVE